MYYYIVNPSAGGGRIEDLQNKLKSRLHQLGIDGEFAKTLGKNDAAKITKAALAHGASTVVAVGGDKTVNEIIAAVHASDKPHTAIGIIPLGRRNHLAGLLSLGSWQQAVRLLAARRLHSFRLMTLNHYLFLHQAEFRRQNPGQSWQLLAEIDKKYKLRAELSSCRLSNLRLHNPHLADSLFLQISGTTVKPHWWQRTEIPSRSQLLARSLTLEFSEPTAAVIDGHRITSNAYRLRLSDTPVRLITNQLHETTGV